LKHFNQIKILSLTLLALSIAAPATTAVNSAFSTEPAVVQAATTNQQLNGQYNINPITVTLPSGTAIYKDPNASNFESNLTAEQIIQIKYINIVNGQIFAVRYTTFGWLNEPYDHWAKYAGLSSEIGNTSLSLSYALPLFSLDSNSTWTSETGNIHPGAGVQLAVDGFTLDATGTIVSYTGISNNTRYSVAAEEMRTGSATPVSSLHEDSNVPANLAVVIPKASGGALIYSDMQTTQPINAKILTNQKVIGLVRDASNQIVAYKIDQNQYLNANDVTTPEVDTNQNADITFNILPAGTKVYSNNKAAIVYSDPTTTTDTGTRLSTSYNSWNATRYATDKNGQILAYELGTNQWVKAADLTTTASDGSNPTVTGNVTISLLNQTNLYSYYKPAVIYTDPTVTTASGARLSTWVNEWHAARVAKDSNGVAIAYELGKNQWVKAADLNQSAPQGGVFDTTGGTPLYDLNGNVTGSIPDSGRYQVFAVAYINGQQFVKIGTDNQWIAAAAGDYYPV
jgi:hypothetical protein